MIQLYDNFDVNELQSGLLVIPTSADEYLQEVNRDGYSKAAKELRPDFSAQKQNFYFDGRLKSSSIPNATIEADERENLRLLPLASRSYYNYKPDDRFKTSLQRLREALQQEDNRLARESAIHLPITCSNDELIGPNGFYSPNGYACTREEIIEHARDLFGDLPTRINLLRLKDPRQGDVERAVADSVTGWAKSPYAID